MKVHLVCGDDRNGRSMIVPDGVRDVRMPVRPNLLVADWSTVDQYGYPPTHLQVEVWPVIPLHVEVDSSIWPPLVETEYFAVEPGLVENFLLRVA